MKKGFKITQAVEVTEALIEYRDNYNDRGKYLGFENLNDLYTMQLGTCTDWTGFPRSGKTQVLMELLLNTSLYYGWKHLVYFPDVGSNVEIIADLLHKKTAKCFNPKYKNVISDQDIYRETEWLLEHFKVLTKADVKAKLTPFEFYDMAASMKDEIQTASIDSWKDMSHPYNEYGGYAMYLEAVLPYRNQTAEEPYCLKGGSEWFNSGKCMITVHRESTDTIIADIMVHKVKPRSCGNVGFCSLEFDVEKLVYFTTEQTVNGNVKRYATERSKPAKVEAIKPPKQLTPNKDFNINNRIEPQGKVEDWEEPGLDLWQ
jgi:hypothetical protein